MGLAIGLNRFILIQLFCLHLNFGFFWTLKADKITIFVSFEDFDLLLNALQGCALLLIFEWFALKFVSQRVKSQVEVVDYFLFVDA